MYELTELQVSHNADVKEVELIKDAGGGYRGWGRGGGGGGGRGGEGGSGGRKRAVYRKEQGVTQQKI